MIRLVSPHRRIVIDVQDGDVHLNRVEESKLEEEERSQIIKGTRCTCSKIKLTPQNRLNIDLTCAETSRGMMLQSGYRGDASLLLRTHSPIHRSDDQDVL